MSLSKANIGLMEGEEVIFEKQTKIGEEKKRFSLHRTGYGYITLTNRRVVISSTNKMCNCIESEKQVRIILPSTISTIGYEKKNRIQHTISCIIGFFIVWLRFHCFSKHNNSTDNNHHRDAIYTAGF